jgi:NADPH:quinone reductase
MSTAIRMHSTGGPEVLSTEEIAVGEPGPTEVRVRQRAVGVNFIDTYHRTGLYPLELPSGIGVEAAGVVVAAGREVTDLTIGSRVAYAGGSPGAYADERVVAADRVVPLPDDIELETAAAVLLKGMTVEVLIRRVYTVKPGDDVLFHAAAGGVGLLACQWLRALGARVLACVGSDEKAALAREHGAQETIVTTREDFVERVRSLTDGRGVRVVYDSVGKATLPRSLDCLSPRGMLVSFGNASGKPDAVDPLALGKGSLFLTRPVLFHYTHARNELLESANAVFDMVRRGSVRVRIGQRFELTEARQAHEALEARRTTGSTLLIPSWS